MCAHSVHHHLGLHGYLGVVLRSLYSPVKIYFSLLATFLVRALDLGGGGAHTVQDVQDAASVVVPTFPSSVLGMQPGPGTCKAGILSPSSAILRAELAW